ncbi:MAG: PIG-L deacetylase family protein [Candidatus Dormibacteria bacterium]
MLARRGVAASALSLVGLFWVVNELRMPAPDLSAVERVLAVFPHPDDETVSCGGTLHRLTQLGKRVTLVALTRGERGYAPNSGPVELGTLRAGELAAAARWLGVSRLIQLGLPDGDLSLRRQELRHLLSTVIDTERPDLLITYDLAGLYGHPDHVTCAEVVTELSAGHGMKIRLWYVALPHRLRWGLVRLGALPRDSARSPAPARPTTKLFVGPSLGAKVRAWRSHHSQRHAIGNGVGRLVPGWLLAALQPFEYFEEVPRQ